MKILFIGDICGEPGRRAVAVLLPGLREKFGPDLVIANAENVAGGKGITEDTGKALFKSGIDLLTSGNHHWDKKGIEDYMAKEPRLIRHANYPSVERFPCPGKGFIVVTAKDGTKVGVLNLQGRVFMPPIDCPFRTADEILSELRNDTNVIVVDMHAEATSEKRAMGFYLDGRVSGVIGTHTHVQTADEQIMPHGTAYITDVGMTGPINSGIGVEFKQVLQRFITMRPIKYDIAKEEGRMNGVVIEIDPKSG